MIIDTNGIKHKKILITGQGRGGTSAIASIFYHLGYYMPDASQLASMEDRTLQNMLKKDDINGLIQELASRERDWNLVAWKEPKLFSGNGLKLVDSLNKDWTYIIVFRDPYAIAYRNNISMGADIDQALIHAANNNRKLAGFYEKTNNILPCYLVSYEKLITKPDETLGKLLAYLGVSEPHLVLPELIEKLQQDKQRYLSVADNNLN